MNPFGYCVQLIFLVESQFTHSESSSKMKKKAQNEDEKFFFAMEIV